MYKTELHCHSSDVSSCARADAAMITELFSKAGYTSLVLTNHFNSYTYNHLKSQSWSDFMDKYMAGVKNLRAAAEGKMNILLGIELRNESSCNDYLIYGLSEEFLRKNEFFYNHSLSEIHSAVKDEGAILIQAHPFRNGMTVVNPEDLDGVEIFNGHHGHDSRNKIAAMWAEKYNLVTTAGTDFHYTHSVPNGGILTDEPVTSEKQLVEILKSGSYTLIKEDW